MYGVSNPHLISSAYHMNTVNNEIQYGIFTCWYTTVCNNIQTRNDWQCLTVCKIYRQATTDNV